MERAAIIGTGLIGASIGLALGDQGWEVKGWDPTPEALALATERGAVQVSGSPHDALIGADLVFLAGPLSANLSTLAGLSTTALVTDVTGVKQPLLPAVPAGVRFVGGHPMAGREHAGPAAASGALFRGAAWILCDDGAAAEDVELLKVVVGSIGANPVVMPADHHDRVVAAISHLPQLLAVALVDLVSHNPDTAELVSGSFRDLTRVALTESDWWPEVLAANSDSVSVAWTR